MLGGTVAVDSQVGVGSTFTVTCEVDLADEAEAAAAAQSEPTDTVALEGKRILLVEDDALVRYVVAEQLGSMGCAVQTAGSAEEGLRALHDAQFDAVMADLQLGRVDGTVLARAVHRAFAQATRGARPVLVACTGDTSPPTVQACLQAGFDAHLPKPATVADLRSVLTRLFSRTGGTAESGC